MSKLIHKNHETKWIHAIDPENKLNPAKAKKGCRHCHGTGIIGRMHLEGARIVCKCVVRRTIEDESIVNREAVGG